MNPTPIPTLAPTPTPPTEFYQIIPGGGDVIIKVFYEGTDLDLIDLHKKAFLEAVNETRKRHARFRVQSPATSQILKKPNQPCKGCPDKMSF